MRRERRPWIVSSWYFAQAAPRSTNSLRIVGFDTPVMRAVARMLLPSTSG